MLNAGSTTLCVILALAIPFAASSSNMGVFDVPFSIILYDQSATTASTTTTATTTTTTTTATTRSSTTASSTPTVSSIASGSTASSPAASGSTAPSSAASDSTAPSSTASSSTASSSTASSSTASTVRTTTTPAPSTTTMSTATIQLITANLTYFLYSQFHNTTGFVSVSVPTPMSGSNAYQLTMTYSVVFNKTTLNANGMLSSNSTFIYELFKVCSAMSSTSESFYGYKVNQNATAQSMIGSIYLVSQAFNDTTWVCSGIECSKTSTCAWNDTMSMAMCTDKCSLFIENSQCTEPPSLPGVYLQGTCNYDANWQPYCDCGMSSGNVMANFYDGYQCVSSTFIVAMSATAGGVLFLLCIALICVINQQREAIAQAKKILSKYKLSNPPAASSQQVEAAFTNKAVYEYNDPTINTITKNEVYRSENRPHAGVETGARFGFNEDESASAQL